MRIRVIQQLPLVSIDGIRLDRFQIGGCYELGPTLSSLFLAEGWAEPAPTPAGAEPVLKDESGAERALYRLMDTVRGNANRSGSRASAADRRRSRRKRSGQQD